MKLRIAAAISRRAAVAVAMVVMSTIGAARAQDLSDAGTDDDLAGVPMQQATVEAEASADPAATSTTGARAAETAGAHGDALVAGQSLPGVARPPLGTGQLVIWGASPQETKLLIDGIEVPALYHQGGLRSVVPAELVDGISLHPAAFGAEYGRALGGVLDAELEIPRVEAAPQLDITVDPLDAHAAVSTPLGESNVYAGARYSLLDRILGPVLSDDARAVFPLPRYWDAQLLANIPLRAGESLELILLSASDSSQRTLDLSDATETRGDTSDLRWARLGARYRRALEGGAEATALIWLGDELQSESLFAGAAASTQIRWAQSGGLRADWSAPAFFGDRASNFLSFNLGVDALFTHSTFHRTGSLTTPPREGDVTAFGEAPGLDVVFDRWSVDQSDAALHAESKLNLGRVSLTAGLRLSGLTTDVSRATPRVALTPGVGLSQLEWFAEPRLSATVRLADSFRLIAAAGLHHQAADPQDLSAVFGSPSLGASRAVHALAAASWRAFPDLELEASGFYRRLDELAVRSPLPTPQLVQALVQSGTGQVVGMQTIARYGRSGPLTGFLSLLISRSDRQDSSGGPTRLFDFDQPLLATAAVDWHLEETTLSARFRLASGYPRTPVLGSYLDSQSGQLQPIFGAQNSDRLPLFAQLDLRAAHLFHLGGSQTLRISLDVLNATDHQNAEEFIYSTNWQNRGVLNGLPIAALLGLEWKT